MNESEPKAVVEHSVEAAVQPSGELSDALLPCPFCACLNIAFKFEGDSDGDCCYCAACNAEGPYVIGTTAELISAWNKRAPVPDSSGSVTKRGEANEQAIHLALSVLAWSNEEDRRGPRVEEFKLKVIKEARGVVDSVGATVQRPAEDSTR